MYMYWHGLSGVFELTGCTYCLISCKHWPCTCENLSRHPCCDNVRSWNMFRLFVICGVQGNIHKFCVCVWVWVTFASVLTSEGVHLYINTNYDCLCSSVIMTGVIGICIVLNKHNTPGRILFTLRFALNFTSCCTCLFVKMCCRLQSLLHWFLKTGAS